MKDLLKGAALFLGGAMIGATVALLLAPKTGEEMRQEIKDLAEEAKKNVHDYCEQMKQDLADANAAAEPAEPAEPKKEEA